MSTTDEAPAKDPLRVTQTIRTGVRRRTRRTEIAAALSRWDTDGGAGESASNGGGVRAADQRLA